MRVGDPGNHDSFLVVAATFLIGVAFALSSFAPTLNPMEKRAAEDRRARNSTGFGLYECGFYSSAVLNAHRRLQKRAILVVVENSDPIPFHTDPRLVPWARSGVSFPLAVRVSNDLSADLSAMGTGFGIRKVEERGGSRPLGYPLRSIRGWRHGSIHVTGDRDLTGSSNLLCWPMTNGQMTTDRSETDRRTLSIDRLKADILDGDFDADLVYVEYTAFETSTPDLLVELRDALNRRGEWNGALIAVAALPSLNLDTATVAPPGSRPFSLFIKFPDGAFAGRVSSLTVSSYDLGNTLREHFDQPIAMASLREMLRDEPRHRSRFVFGGERGEGLTWVRAGRFEYDVRRRQVFDVDADELREHDISTLAQSFKQQAIRIVEAWPKSIDRSLFDGAARCIEDSWAQAVTPVDPFAGSSTHFIYK